MVLAAVFGIVSTPKVRLEFKTDYDVEDSTVIVQAHNPGNTPVNAELFEVNFNNVPVREVLPKVFTLVADERRRFVFHPVDSRLAEYGDQVSLNYRYDWAKDYMGGVQVKNHWFENTPPAVVLRSSDYDQRTSGAVATYQIVLDPQKRKMPSSIRGLALWVGNAALTNQSKQAIQPGTPLILKKAVKPPVVIKWKFEWQNTPWSKWAVVEGEMKHLVPGLVLASWLDHRGLSGPNVRRGGQVALPSGWVPLARTGVPGERRGTRARLQNENIWQTGSEPVGPASGSLILGRTG